MMAVVYKCFLSGRSHRDGSVVIGVRLHILYGHNIPVMCALNSLKDTSYRIFSSSSILTFMSEKKLLPRKFLKLLF